MESKELRLGNLLEYYIDTDNLGWQTFEVHWEDIRLCKEQNESFNKDNRPIPLTEEWKGKIKNDKNILIDSVGFVIFKNGYAYQFVFEDYPFVHQFQNLYFALCGEELQLQ